MKIKNLFFFALLFTGGVMHGYCQNATKDIKQDTIPAGWANLDYSTPSDPAFKILGTDPDNILKPTSVKAIAANIGTYFLTGGNAVPKSLSVEISPMLLSKNIFIGQYQRNAFWYKTRFSLGTAQNINGFTKVAEGVKSTIIDKSDSRLDTIYVHQLAELAKNDAISYESATESYAKMHKMSLTEAKDKYESDTKIKKAIDSLAKRQTALVHADKAYLQKDFKTNHWNAAVWDAGIATLQTSKDSLVKNLQFSKAGLWTTGGIPVFKTDGQLLIGGKIEVQDSVKWQTNFSIGSRLYYGSNGTRAYAQGEYKYEKHIGAADFGIGCLFNITNGIWGQVAFNFVLDNAGKLSYIPSFNIGFGTGDSKK